MEEKIGVFLSRMQPLHIGHIGMIRKALAENDRVIILIGSSNKEGTVRNPMGVRIRRKILDEALLEEFSKNELERIIVKELPDWSSEDDFASNLEWGRYLYYNVVSVSASRCFSMYFSDEPQIIQNWFQDDIIKNRVELRIFERNNMFEAVSSTKIRNAFLNNDMDYIKKSVPNSVVKRFDEIYEILNKVYTENKMEE